MFRSRFRVITLLALVVLAAVVLVLARPVREWFALQALDAAIENEVLDTSRHVSGSDPFAPPSFGERMLDRLLLRHEWTARYHEQAQYFIHGPLVNLRWQGGTVVGDVRAALARLPRHWAPRHHWPGGRLRSWSSAWIWCALPSSC